MEGIPLDWIKPVAYMMTGMNSGLTDHDIKPFPNSKPVPLGSTPLIITFPCNTSILQVHAVLDITLRRHGIMSFPGSNPDDLLMGLPKLDPLPNDIDIFSLYQKIFSGPALYTPHMNLWTSGVVSVRTADQPPLLMLRAHNLISHRIRYHGPEMMRIDWVQLVLFDDIMSCANEEGVIYNTLTGRTKKIPAPFL